MAKKKSRKANLSAPKEEKVASEGRAITIKLEWIVVAILAIIVVLSIPTFGFRKFPFSSKSVTLTQNVDKDQVEADTVKYINEELLKGQATAEITDISDDTESYLYKITVSIGGKDYNWFVSKDGKYLYTNRLTVAQSTSTENSGSTAGSSAQSFTTKSDKPTVQLYTMSFCPYGNQAEDVVKPVYDLLSSKINFEPHFVIYSNYAKQSGADWSAYCSDSSQKYCSMHGAGEVHEDVRELCVFNEEKDKFWDFVLGVNSSCTSQDVDSCWEGVAQSVGVDVNSVNSCVTSQTDSLLANEVSLDQQYSVTGSPTIIVNGEKYTGSRTSEAFKQALCTAFNTAPDECSQTLDNSTSTTSGNCN